MFKGIKRLISRNKPISNSVTYGETCFMSFYAASVTRMSYFDDNKFIQLYNQIIGNVIPTSILSGINKVVLEGSDLNNLFNDEYAFNLTSGEFKTYSNKEGNQFIDYVAMNMPQDINIITGEMKGTRTYPEVDIGIDQNIKYISLACSNYGNVYIVADKRMPNVIQVIFRGTYSSKTAGSYTKPTSMIPIKITNDSKEAYLYGIYKITTDMLNTIMESIRYLAVNFLEQSEPNSVTVLTFGHSLGGAMTTIFSHLWSKLKTNDFYKRSPYDIFKAPIFCISLGAPRCMNVYASDEFCKNVQSGLITFKRIVTKGDPVPGLPKKIAGFSHPCSSKEMKANGMRGRVNEDCNDVLSKVPFRPKYDSSIKCEPQNSNTITTYNPLSHTLYFYIMYSKAADVGKFFKGMVTQREVKRTKTGQTVVRINIGNQGSLKTAFFVLDHVRDVPSDDKRIEEKAELEKINEPEPQEGGGKVSEDIKMTKELFDFIVSSATEIPEGTDRNLLVPANGEYVNVLEIISTPKTKLITADITSSEHYLKIQEEERKEREKREAEADAAQDRQYRVDYSNYNKGGMRRRKTIRKRTTKRKGTRKN
jgi:hypothetical protein